MDLNIDMTPEEIFKEDLIENKGLDLSLEDDFDILMQSSENNLKNTRFFSENFLKIITAYISDNSIFSNIRKDLIYYFKEEILKIHKKFFPYTDINIKTLIRYNIICEGLIDNKQKEKILKIPFFTETLSNIEKYSIFYLDEWINLIGNKEIFQSEKITRKENNHIDYNKQENHITRSIIHIKKRQEEKISKRNKNIRKMQNIMQLFLEDNSKEPTILKEEGKKLTSLTASINKYAYEIQKLKKTITDLEKKYSILKNRKDLSKKYINYNIIEDEIDFIMEIMELLMHDGGIKFPFLIKEYFPTNINYREKIRNSIIFFDNIIKNLFIFNNNEKTETIPFFTILPIFSNKGTCFKPFEEDNIMTGPGRIFLPLYSKITTNEVICNTLGEFYWLKHKNLKGNSWMTEGLTGKYLKIHKESLKKKINGKYIKSNPDIKENFIKDFSIWLLDESKGHIKLESEVRKLFWEHIPFKENIKKNILSNSQIYRDLEKNFRR